MWGTAEGGSGRKVVLCIALWRIQKNGITSGPVSFSDTNKNHAPLSWGVAEAHL
jgi:hypothetical protein